MLTTIVDANPISNDDLTFIHIENSRYHLLETKKSLGAFLYVKITCFVFTKKNYNTSIHFNDVHHMSIRRSDVSEVEGRQ